MSELELSPWILETSMRTKFNLRLGEMLKKNPHDPEMADGSRIQLSGSILFRGIWILAAHN